jgi:cell division protein FtsW (lipid II flippase)
MKKVLIVVLIVSVLFSCVGLVSANPYWDHDEQSEQRSDFWCVGFCWVVGAIFLFRVIMRSESEVEVEASA